MTRSSRYWIRDNVVDIDYEGSAMPPAKAVEGTYEGPDGKKVKVAPLSDEDRRTIVRWIDLGCPIDLDPGYDPKSAAPKSHGWMGDDQRPTLTLTYPAAGANEPLTRILVGMTDAYSGLDMASFTATADFAVGEAEPGKNLAALFKETSRSIWSIRLPSPLKELKRGKLTVSVQDRQGNVSKVERVFSVR